MPIVRFPYEELKLRKKELEQQLKAAEVTIDELEDQLIVARLRIAAIERGWCTNCEGCIFYNRADSICFKARKKIATKADYCCEQHTDPSGKKSFT
jgi:hypothetical protein